MSIAESEIIRSVKVAVDLGPEIAARAEQRGLSFSDEAHRRLEASFGLHDGTGLIREGRVAPLRRRWRCSPHGKSTLWLHESVAELLNAAAAKSGWSVADEVNKRLADGLEADARTTEQAA